MLDQVMAAFGLMPDIDLDLMQAGQSLADYASRSLSAVSTLLETKRPDAVLVQGDTTTVMATSLAAFYHRIPVGHVEAGLRSGDRYDPFPEEINRRLAASLVSFHFAPTDRARLNLVREGIPESEIFVTGNTIVDALSSFGVEGDFDDRRLSQIDFVRRRVVLVTAHRRESHGPALRSICRALSRLSEAVNDIEIVYPVHMNPNVAGPVHDELSGRPNIHLTEPVTYPDLLRLINRCYLVLTDSGGIQEEAPSFHKPVLVLRQTTERPELIEAGGGKLVGVQEDRIIEESVALLNDRAKYEAMANIVNPFGDGHAAERIVDILASRLC